MSKTATLYGSFQGYLNFVVTKLESHQIFLKVDNFFLKFM
jgi:hypothetical protein